MDQRLIDFLTPCEVDKSEDFTHTSKIKPMRRYAITDDKLNDFYQIYNTVVSEGGIAGITEKPQTIIPLIVDIDFRCTLDGGLKRYYKPKHIRDIVAIYQSIIAEITVDANERTFYCCVLEKTGPVNYQGCVKDGFHLHFPYFYTEAWVQKEYIRSAVIKRVQEEKILGDIPIVESIDKIFDKNIPAVCWLMYGSRKDVKSEAYQLTKSYNKDLELLQLKDVYKHKYPEGERTWNLPRYLSLRQDFTETPLKGDVKNHKPSTRKKAKREYTRNLDEILSDLVACAPLVEMLDYDRANGYATWIEIGWILYNISEGHEKGLELWLTFSQKCPEKFTEGKCETEWEKMDLRGYTIGTLKHLAKNDSPNEYYIWKDMQINSILYQGISMAHNDIAKILYMMFDNNFVCADVEKEIWYEFSSHRWRRSAKGINLRWHISHTLTNKYASLASKYMSQLQDEEDQAQKQMYNSKVTMICKLIEKLKNNAFKNSLMKEAMEYFYDKDFVENMDENPNLLVFENGVYDAETRTFRDGRPDDYCTKCTNLHYREYDQNDEKIIEIEAMLKKIFPNPKIYKFFKQTVSDLIKGGNRHKIFVIWTGCGDNGKSICADLLEKALGDYYYTPPTTLLTGKQQQSSGATSELIPCKGARGVVVSETDNADVLNCGTMKKLTGGDPFYARGNFKDAIKITPQFKLILHCNKMPNISAEDKASWNRIRVLLFQSVFVNAENAPETIEEQFEKYKFPKDKTLKERLGGMAEAFVWWLIKEYEAFGDADLYEPSEVRAATDAYQRTNDFYMQFMDERIQETGDKTDFITLTVVYALFKEWYRDSFPGRQIPSRLQVKEAMEKKLGKQVKGLWYGVSTFDPEANMGCESDTDPKPTKRLAVGGMKGSHSLNANI